MANRSDFKSNTKFTGEFTPTVKTPTKHVKSPTDNNFDSNGLDSISPKKEILNKNRTFNNEPIKKTSKKRGRPVEVINPLDKVNRPKMVSTTTEIKLNVLKDFVTEFQEVSGRITFDKYLDTLIESYINRNLTYSKQEAFKRELDVKIEEKS